MIRALPLLFLFACGQGIETEPAEIAAPSGCDAGVTVIQGVTELDGGHNEIGQVCPK